MAGSKRSAGLQVIFSIFLGLMVTAFVGVGVYTFYPSPDEALNRQIEDLSRREQEIRNLTPVDEMTGDVRQELQGIIDDRNAIRDEIKAVLEPWMRTTSIILIVFATLVMAVSIVRADQLPVISNGLLLGGVFTMIYGVGWIIATDSSVSRFVVMTVALVITLTLGYVRFVRRRALAGTEAERMGESASDISDIESRLEDVERRLNAAGSALNRGVE